jgi:Tfp pilus assembly protein PilP
MNAFRHEKYPFLLLPVCWIICSAYTYRPEGKTDPFAPLSLIRPTLTGSTRLQQHEISEFELVGTLFGRESTALLMTPDPKEGVIARIGDRIGRHGGRIVSIARDRVLTREPSAKSVPGQSIQFTDIVIQLSRSRSSEKPKDPKEQKK